MKRVIGVSGTLCLLSVCLMLMFGCAPKRNFAGTWTGNITISIPQMKQPMTIPLTIHIAKKDDGTYSAAAENPMQKQTTTPLDSFKIDGDKVSFGVDKQGSGFTGTSNSDGTEIAGNLTSGGKSLPLTLKKQPEPK